jgi:hypothetical protein
MAQGSILDRALLILNTLILVSGGSVWAAAEGYRLFQQRPVEYDGELTVTELKRYDDGSRLYDVQYDVEAKNLSKSRFAISFSFAELYVGNAKAEILKIGDAAESKTPSLPS